MRQKAPFGEDVNLEIVAHLDAAEAKMKIVEVVCTSSAAQKVGRKIAKNLADARESGCAAMQNLQKLRSMAADPSLSESAKLDAQRFVSESEYLIAHAFKDAKKQIDQAIESIENPSLFTWALEHPKEESKAVKTVNTVTVQQLKDAHALDLRNLQAMRKAAASPKLSPSQKQEAERLVQRQMEVVRRSLALWRRAIKERGTVTESSELKADDPEHLQKQDSAPEVGDAREIQSNNTQDISQDAFDRIAEPVSGPPLDAYEPDLKRLGVVCSVDLLHYLQAGGSSRVTLAGTVLSAKERTSAKGNKFAFVQFSDAGGTFDVMVFSELLAKSRELFTANKTLLVTADTRIEGETVKLLAYDVRALDEAMASKSAAFTPAKTSLTVEQAEANHQTALENLATLRKAAMHPMLSPSKKLDLKRLIEKQEQVVALYLVALMKITRAPNAAVSGPSPTNIADADHHREPQRTCKKCGDTFALNKDHFGHMPAGGYRWTCRRCVSGNVRGWQQENPEQAHAILAKRNELHEKNGRVPTSVLEEYRARRRHEQGDCCHYCKCQLEGGGDLDHLVPIAQGGGDVYENLVLSCQRCNNEKHAKTADEYRAWLKRHGHSPQF